MAGRDRHSFLTTRANFGSDVQESLRSPVTPRERKLGENHRMELAKMESERRRAEFGGAVMRTTAREFHDEFVETVRLFAEQSADMDGLPKKYRKILDWYTTDILYLLGDTDAKILETLRDLMVRSLGKDITPEDVAELKSRVTLADWLRGRVV